LAHNVGPIASGHIIPFDDVMLNEGNAYNGNDGVFVCPHEGLYLFLWNTLSSPNKEAAAAMTVNGIERQESYSNGSPYYASAGGFAIVRLNQGDHVYMSIRSGRTNQYLNDYESAFAGVSLSY